MVMRFEALTGSKSSSLFFERCISEKQLRVFADPPQNFSPEDWTCLFISQH